MNHIGSQARWRTRWIALLLLWLFWGRLLHTAAVTSATFDEMFHILQGALYWQRGSLEPVTQNPPLVAAFIGLPVSLVFRPSLPAEHAVWASGDWLRIAQVFLWAINDNGLQLLWAGRLATMSLALWLGALLYRWGRELWPGRLAGLLALFFCSFDPNILAHGALATADLGAAFFLCLAAYLVWRYWRLWDSKAAPQSREFAWRRRGSSVGLPYLLAGAAIGCTLAAKFSGLVLLPALGLMAGYRRLAVRESRPDWKRAAAELAGWLALAGLLFLVVYRFDLTALATDFARQQEHQLTGHSSYLFGALSQEGWWYYFPVVFAIKTPLPVLILLAVTLAVWVAGRRYDWQLLWPLVIAGGIGAAALVSRVNIGYRYLLPALPLVYLFLSAWLTAVGWGFKRGDGQSPPGRLALLMLLWTAAESLLIHPDYLAYFNQLAGGPENGWRFVVDSNIDWGQDIQSLGRYLADEGVVEPVNVAWLGTAPLEAYGVNGVPLPAWPVAPEEMLYSPFYPPRPAPGTYVLSVTPLQGVYLSDPERFAWFRSRPPADRVGYSLFVYHVTADGPPVAVALSGVALATVSPADFDRVFASNDLQPRWYDARRAVLWPAGGQNGPSGQSWAVVGEGHLPSQPVLRAMYPEPALSGQGADGLRYRLFGWDESPISAALARAAAARSLYSDFGWPAEPVIGAGDWATGRRPLAGAALFGGALQLLAYELVGEPAGEGLTLVSYWRVSQGAAGGLPAGLTIFVHLLDGTGQVVAQYDGLDVRPAGLQADDEFAQLHLIPLPAGLPAGPYALQIGLYDSETGARLTVPTPAGLADRLLLHRLVVP